MICLIENIEDFNNDLRVMLMAFYMGVKIVTPENIAKKPELADEIEFTLKADFGEDGIRIYISDGLVLPEDMISNKMPGASNMDAAEVVPDVFISCNYHDRKDTRNKLKLAIYNLLSKRTGKVLPWGSLTGVKPVKIAMAGIESGLSDDEVIEEYEKIYGASREKAEMCVRIARREKELIKTVDECQEYCLYIGIPFCPTRCLYCSFTSYPIAKYTDKVDLYLDAVEKEIKFVADSYKNKRLSSIYIGGGTPSSIGAEEMDRLCRMIEEKFDMSHVREFTIEAGRPDSTTFDKLVVMKNHNVSRISINPQTMNDETLKLIGRAHTSRQTAEAFENARNAGFDNINMDIIVGLPAETSESVSRTLDKIKKLSPESLTVHTLAVKRAANLKQEMDKYRDSIAGDTDKQLMLVNKAAGEMGLSPYYLYRQKNMAGNLENTGYSKRGLECLYNILIMEERTDIIGIGAGSSSKLVYGTRTGRVENCKNVDEYISRIDEMIERKRVAFAK